MNQSLRESGAAVQGREDGGLNPARIDLLRASEGQRPQCLCGWCFLYRVFPVPGSPHRGRGTLA